MYEIYLKLLKDKGVKTSDVCKATGIVASTFTDWKKGKSKPKQEKLLKIADYFGVSLDYLMTGSDKKYSTEDALLIKKYYSLDDRKKKHVLELIDLLSEK